MVLGGALASYTDVFLEMLRVNRGIIVKQIADLRSLVAREACRMIAALASAFGALRADGSSHKAFGLMLDEFVEQLLKLTVVTIKVMSESGDKCIQEIVTSTEVGYHRVYERFIRGCSGKSGTLRRHCVNYINLALNSWATSSFERHASATETTLCKTLADSDSGARVISRECFWSFHAHFPDRAAQMLKTKVDASTRRRIEQSKSGGEVAAVAVAPRSQKKRRVRRSKEKCNESPVIISGTISSNARTIARSIARTRSPRPLPRPLPLPRLR